MGEKRTRVSLTALQKKEICRRASKANIQQKALAKEYGVSPQQVSDILKNKDQWLSIESETSAANFKRIRRVTFENIEEAMKIWVDNILSRDELNLSDGVLIEKAREFAIEFGISDRFLASTGWVKNFKRRNNLRSYKKRGEAGDVDKSSLPQHCEDIQSILINYDKKDIYNCDETALFWLMEPNRTLSHGPVQGRKKRKDRVSLLLTANATGDDKLPILFIHKYENPRPLRGINKDTLPVWYYWNVKAWMQRSIFKSYLQRLNLRMRLAKRKIILLMDNARCHEVDEEGLSNVRIYFLPPNTTSGLQPLDQGIIYSFKVNVLC